MKRILIILAILSISAECFSQGMKMSMQGDVVEQSKDMDARIYFPKKDYNNKLCALIKVTLADKMESHLLLDVGGLGVVDREEKEGGEVWFYVPYQVKNLYFKCAGYTPIDPVPVKLKEGTVYSLTIVADGGYQKVYNASLQSNFFKIDVNEPDYTIFIGKSKDYELLVQTVQGNMFTQLLDYGKYYYKISHPLFEECEGVVEISDQTPTVKVNLIPAYSQLEFVTVPEGASIYVNNEYFGHSPFKGGKRYRRGEIISYRVQKENYKTINGEIVSEGKGVMRIELEMEGQFAPVTLRCEDTNALIYVDDEYKGKGEWSGNLGSITQHIVEVRRAGHQSQRVALKVENGQEQSVTIPSPVALYGTLVVESTPNVAKVTIDGEMAGETPLIKQLLVGDHTVEITKDGYAKETRSIKIGHNKSESISVTLQEGQSQSIPFIPPKFTGNASGSFGEWIGANIKSPYTPENAFMLGIEGGKVIISFVVSKDGTVTDVKVKKGVEPKLDAEALRVVSSSPRWIPGKKDNLPVNVRYDVPVTFKLY